MKTLLVVMGLFVSMNSYANTGHRAGGDWFKHMPENSLIVLEESILGSEGGYALQYADHFEYLESLRILARSQTVSTNRPGTRVYHVVVSMLLLARYSPLHDY